MLVWADADNRGFHFKQGMQTILKNGNIKHELCVDSKGLYDTITTSDVQNIISGEVLSRVYWRINISDHVAILIQCTLNGDDTNT